MVAGLDVESSVAPCVDDVGDVLVVEMEEPLTILGQRSVHPFPCRVVISVVSNKVWFLTTGPLIGTSVVFAELSCERTACVSSRSHEKKKTRSSTYTVASSFVCTSPLAVIPVVGFSGYPYSVQFR